MTRKKRRLYVPPRNLVGSLVPTFIVTWYFLDKAGSNLPLQALFVVVAVLVQLLMILASTKTHRSRRSFFWGLYDFLTGNARLPFRLLVNAIGFIAVSAFAFDISGLKSAAGVPSAFIARYVEVNLYWSALSFLGLSDSSIEPLGFSKYLTIVVAAAGLVFWGMYISILINKHLEMRDLSRRSATEDELDRVMYNESSAETGVQQAKYEIFPHPLPRERAASDSPPMQSPASLQGNRVGKLGPMLLVVNGVFWCLSTLLLIGLYRAIRSHVLGR